MPDARNPYAAPAAAMADRPNEQGAASDYVSERRDVLVCIIPSVFTLGLYEAEHEEAIEREARERTDRQS
jgi:hypothetical protein